MTPELIEKVAEALYRHESGFTDEDYLAIYAKPRRAWKTDAPWDTNPNELCEWQRDGYRAQAKAAIRLVVESMTARVPSFKEAWEKKKIEGYRYGPDALEQVRFGWDIRSTYAKGEP